MTPKISSANVLSPKYQPYLEIFKYSLETLHLVNFRVANKLTGNLRPDSGSISQNTGSIAKKRKTDAC